jgi:transcriptional regulator with GAF, ATPase, and Fis domain
MSTHHDEEARLFSRLVSLADALVGDFDVLDTANALVHDCAEFLPVRDAGIMVENQQRRLQVLASTSAETRVLEFFELQSHEGPCLEAFSHGQTVVAPDLLHRGHRWRTFRAHALALGFRSAYAVPLHLHGKTVGALNLFCPTAHGLDADEVRLAHRLATMATLGILTHRTMRQHEVLAEQLQHALDVRVVIEQAKGVVAERAGVAMSTAAELLRAAARSSRRPLAVVSRDVIAGKLRTDDLKGWAAVPRPRPPHRA